MTKDRSFVDAQEDVIENLEAIQLTLSRCVEQGMIDLEDAFYNQVIDLIEDARVLKTWGELMEIVSQAKTLESDVDAWLSLHGKTTLSLIWPHPK